MDLLRRIQRLPGAEFIQRGGRIWSQAVDNTDEMKIRNCNSHIKDWHAMNDANWATFAPRVNRLKHLRRNLFSSYLGKPVWQVFFDGCSWRESLMISEAGLEELAATIQNLEAANIQVAKAAQELLCDTCLKFEQIQEEDLCRDLVPYLPQIILEDKSLEGVSLEGLRASMGYAALAEEVVRRVWMARTLEWEVYIIPGTDRQWYWNQRHNAYSYELPAAPAIIWNRPATDSQVWERYSTPETGQHWYWNEHTQAVSFERPASPAIIKGGMHVWEVCVDTETGKYWYWNERSEAASWELPAPPAMILLKVETNVETEKLAWLFSIAA